MKCVRFLTLFASLTFYAAAAHAYRIDGSVFLMPIDSSLTFRSVGSAAFVDDLNRPTTFELHGTHTVSGPQVYTSDVSGAGSYSYIFEGPASAGACYTTSLYVWTVRGFVTFSQTFNGNSRCAPSGAGGGGGGGVQACDHCNDGGMQNEPLILDLNGDGIWTTAKTQSPVWFDLTGNGVADRTAWTAPDHEDGFLYVDWNGNRKIDGGQELFGDATLMPDGSKARHGYEALSAYDDPAYGGNGDGVITVSDRIWPRLWLWVDRNHDALVSNDENSTLAGAGVIAISLAWRGIGPERDYGADENGNLHLLQGNFTRRSRGRVQQFAMHEVYFSIDRY